MALRAAAWIPRRSLSRMELRHLRYFVAIAEHEHIGRAARVLHVSSSPLSRQIHQLEEDIGVQRLARVGRRVQLTEAGKVFQREARETLAHIDRAIATAQAASRGEVGRLRVAFVEVRRIAESTPPAVRQFRARHPHVTVELVPMRMREQLEAFDAGRIDALEIDALLTFRVGREPPGFNVEQLFTERLELMVARDHALARQKRVKARDLVGVPIIWMPRDGAPFYYDLVRTALNDHGIRPRHRRRDDEPDRAPESRRQRDGRDLRLAVRALQGGGRAPGRRPAPRLRRRVAVAATGLSAVAAACLPRHPRRCSAAPRPAPSRRLLRGPGQALCAISSYDR